MKNKTKSLIGGLALLAVAGCRNDVEPKIEDYIKSSPICDYDRCMWDFNEDGKVDAVTLGVQNNNLLNFYASDMETKAKKSFYYRFEPHVMSEDLREILSNEMNSHNRANYLMNHVEWKKRQEK